MSFVWYYRYRIYNLADERKYIVSANISICFETSGPCELTVPVLDSVKLTKVMCDWGLDTFAIKGKNNKTNSRYFFLIGTTGL